MGISIASPDKEHRWTEIWISPHLAKASGSASVLLCILQMLTHKIELLADAVLTKSQNHIILALNSDAEKKYRNLKVRLYALTVQLWMWPELLVSLWKP